MNNNMQWLVQDKVLYWNLSSQTTMNDFREGLVNINQTLQGANNKVHLVINARSVRNLQGDNKAVRNIVRYMARNAQLGCLFVVTSSFVFKHHLNRVTTDFGTQLRYSDTFRNAWSTLRRTDSSLPYVAPENPEFATTARKYA